VFFGILIGAFGFGQALPSLAAVASARGAARHIFDVIARVPPIDSFSTAGMTLGPEVAAEIRFVNVGFHYPSRPDVPVLHDLSLVVRPGETVALVGSSGCGKSTTVQLIQRFYDPIAGQVT
jgi:ATP-binding cassette subfamily B (MDR/TAP) protein 1